MHHVLRDSMSPLRVAVTRFKRNGILGGLATVGVHAQRATGLRIDTDPLFFLTSSPVYERRRGTLESKPLRSQSIASLSQIRKFEVACLLPPFTNLNRIHHECLKRRTKRSQKTLNHLSHSMVRAYKELKTLLISCFEFATGAGT